MRLKNRPIFKRILSLVLALTMMIFNLATPSFALTKDANGVQAMDPVQLEMNFSNQHVTVGEETIATLSVKSAKNLYGFDISLKYDPQLFDFESVTPKAEFNLGENGLTHDPTVGNLHILGALKGQKAGVDGNLNLVAVKFKAKDKVGSSNITLLSNSQFSDGDLALYTLPENLVQSIEIVSEDIVTAPTLQGATTDKSGTQIILTFDKEMVNPTNSAGAFSVNASRDGASLAESVTDIGHGIDSTQFILSLDKPLLAGDIVQVSYTPGTLTSIDGGVLGAVDNQTVTNQAPRPVVWDDETHTITISDGQQNLAITPDTVSSAGSTPIFVNIPFGVTNSSFNVASLLQTASAGTVTSSALPALTVSVTVDLNSNGSTPVNVQVQIPQGVTVSAPEGWDGTLNMPTVAATNSVTVSPTNGSTATVNSVIEVGFGDVPLTFSQAVRLLIPGQAGKKAGYVRGGTFYPITTLLSVDNQTAVDNTLAAGQEGYLNNGSDLVIWTKHFTQFVTYTETPIPNGGGSSGGGGSHSTPISTTTITGIITDPTTGKPIVGANVSLYYALTDRNKKACKTPDTLVPLRIINGFKPNNNQNPQDSDASGAYGFKVLPTTDYYFVSTKESYEAYKSPTFSVEQDLVNWNFKMSQSIKGVKRLSGLSSVDTALEIAKANYTGKLSNVVLATAENYPDALAGSVLAYKLNAPILLVGSTEADQAKILAYLKSNFDTTGTVYILGGTAVVSAEMEAKVTASGYSHITRLGGIDRYETAVKIADQLGVKTGTPIVLAYGENYPDALAISSIAAGIQSPILLVQKDGISDTVKQEIAKIKPSKVYIIGGEGVISASVESQVADITSLDKTNIVRIGGVDRYETSLAVAQYFNFAGQTICVATGNNFPDALAGSVYAATHNAPIILVDGRLSDQAINYLEARYLTGAALFGGEAVVSKHIEQQLGQLIGK